ncbi:MAG: hypothetical protein J3Q66DRAFT_51318 [Benniella sp.]|nr:MAG: hypothetical protein J3Q66DRAFT_51318 [Benniella sp.]
MTTVAEDTPATQDTVPSPEQLTDIQEQRLHLRLERFKTPVDYHAELKVTQERLEAIAKEERTGADAERVGLEELEKATKAVIEAHEAVSKKKDQLSSLDEDDSDRPAVQSELDQLTKDATEKEYVWSATKEVCHREYGPIVDNYSEPATELKAQAERDIKSLQDQIEDLQKQLELASIKRKQTEEEHRRLADQTDDSPVGDDDQEDKEEKKEEGGEEEKEEEKVEEQSAPTS